jgi:hypothetical protein
MPLTILHPVRLDFEATAEVAGDEELQVGTSSEELKVKVRVNINVNKKVKIKVQ